MDYVEAIMVAVAVAKKKGREGGMTGMELARLAKACIGGVFVVCSLLAGGCGASADNGVATTDDSGTTVSEANIGKYEWFGTQVKLSDRYGVSTLADLEDRSVAIALVRAEETTLNLLPENEQVPTPSGEGRPLGNTLTRVVVERVFKPDGKISEGSVHTIIEYYTTTIKPSDETVTLIFAQGNTLPMVKGEEYILFLDSASHDYGDYEVFGMWTGKYKVSEDIKAVVNVSSLSREQLEAARDSGEDPLYWHLAQEVKEKYVDGQ